MRAIIQRVSSAKVTVKATTRGVVNNGVVVFLGVAPEDSKSDAEKLAKKIVHLRIFEDEMGKMNHSLLAQKGECLVVSQFTLFADCTRGRRPYFGDAAAPEMANALYEYFCACIHKYQVFVQKGVFGAMMQVEVCIHGPVTIFLDTTDF